MKKLFCYFLYILLIIGLNVITSQAIADTYSLMQTIPGHACVFHGKSVYDAEGINMVAGYNYADGLYNASNYYGPGDVCAQYYCPINSYYWTDEWEMENWDWTYRLNPATIDGAYVFVYDGNSDTTTCMDVSASLCYIHLDGITNGVSCGSPVESSALGETMLSITSLPSQYRTDFWSVPVINGWYPYHKQSKSEIHGVMVLASYE